MNFFDSSEEAILQWAVELNNDVKVMKAAVNCPEASASESDYTNSDDQAYFVKPKITKVKSEPTRCKICSIFKSLCKILLPKNP